MSEERNFIPPKQKHQNLRRKIVIDDSDSSCTPNKNINLSFDDENELRLSNEGSPNRQRGYLSDSSSSLEGYIKSLQKLTEPSQCHDHIDREGKRSVIKLSIADSCKSEKSAWEYDEIQKEHYLDQTPTANFPKFRLPDSLYQQLYDFQLFAVQWIVSLHNRGARDRCLRGGILADDMGMGKTFVSLSVLGGLMRAGAIKNALVIAPLSVLRNWENESKKILMQCVSNIRISVLSSSISAAERKRILDEATNQRQRGTFHIVITTYGLVRNAEHDFVCRQSKKESHKWDYVLLDEAHNIKNPATAVTKSCHAISQHPETRRLMLSGTPILNDLTELWCLFDFATRGAVLGPMKQFKQSFAIPIELARDSAAGDTAIRIGEQKTRKLQELLKPYFLQRLKADYLKDKLPPKVELVVWTHLSTRQREMYDDFLQKDNNVYSILRGEKISPLVALAELKKLCSHPLLVEKDELDSMTVETLVSLSAKLGVLVRLVNHVRSDHHRVLVFSHSTKMLSVIERVLRKQKVSLLRIDGSTKEQDRQRYVDDFNRDNSTVELMLLSTKAAGVGLTLTGADTVVVYDPSWTPAEDSQAVDRAYRLGQKKPVTVYRLIAAGTVEEKMYERQVHKDGIRRTVFGVEGESVQRYFETNELRELFKLAPAGVCQVMEKVHQVMHGQRLDWTGQDFVFSFDGVVGLSRHDEFYSISDSKKEDVTQKNAFGGGKEDTIRKFLGRSQRALQRTQNDKKQMHRERAINDSQLVSLKDKENGRKKDRVDRCQTKFEPDLRHLLADAENARKPKLALKICLDLLESPLYNCNEFDKLGLHRKISLIAALLDLL
ncbi:hypothetical protein ACA910_010655 [Epithemia clementina (nom. ined.)]